jgi:hypothetical protein
VVSALANEDVGPLDRAWALPAVVALAAAACLPILMHYRDRYGSVSPSPEQQARDLAAVVITVAVMTGGALLLRSRAEWSLDLPVNGIAVAFAVVMLVHYTAGPGIKPHHIAIWGALLVAGALPVWSGDDPSNTSLVLAGGALAVCALLDHRLLSRTFGPADA